MIKALAIASALVLGGGLADCAGSDGPMSQTVRRNAYRSGSTGYCIVDLPPDWNDPDDRLGFTCGVNGWNVGDCLVVDYSAATTKATIRGECP